MWNNTYKCQMLMWNNTYKCLAMTFQSSRKAYIGVDGFQNVKKITSGDELCVLNKF